MSDVLHRTQNVFLRSVNDPDYSATDWIINPVINGQPFRDAGIQVRYTLRNAYPDDTVTEMDAAAKQALDDQALSDSRDRTTSQFDVVDDVLRTFALVLLDELNSHADKINAILDSADQANNLADFKSRMLAIADYPQRSIAQIKTSVRNKLGS